MSMQKKSDDIDFKNATDEDQRQIQDESLQIVKETIDTFFNVGAFEEFYEAAGKSMLILFTVVEKIGKD
ncbi:hypothetical protein MOF05_06050 [Bacillus haynesii]|uniref:hypothetical protein n=1 Tax=Bacillus haynesii TaxID=1925021 RepID=UPI00228198F4|nr:hypothetical protein [Bacillus haynesii]MCY7863120.1 hypothetical protein [Bacillus haynesii]MCY9287954.1 hypothetical protein [Bacillus haynesii]